MERDGLLTDAELFLRDYGAIAVDVFANQIVEELTALTDEGFEGTCGGVVLVVLFEVSGEVSDAL